MGYKLCYQEVLKVVKGIVHQPYELKNTSVLYAFSYYFDRAVDAGLIGERKRRHYDLHTILQASSGLFSERGHTHTHTVSIITHC